MNIKLAARLARLESEIQAKQSAGVWIDMQDNHVRVDVAGRRGDELEFDSVTECAAWVEARMKKAERVTGLALINDIKELCLADMPAEVLAEWDTMPNKAVLLNLHHATESLALTALAAWARSMTGIAYKDSRDRMLQTIAAYA